MTNEKEVREFFLKIEKEHKKVDILVNVVGQSEPGGPVEIDSPTWRKQFTLNLDTAYFCIKFAIPIMEKKFRWIHCKYIICRRVKVYWKTSSWL